MIRSLFLFVVLCFAGTLFAEQPAAKLQSTISLTPIKPALGKPGKIIPATYVKLSATVKNVGSEESPAGEIHVRFAFRPPQQDDPNSILFETERVELPPLAAGEEKVIEYKTNHLLPTVFDFVRNDWALREYEAIIEIDGKKEIAGTRAIAFTAHYYEGASQEKPVTF